MSIDNYVTGATEHSQQPSNLKYEGDITVINTASSGYNWKNPPYHKEAVA
jgi:hypothetical protein